ncbi:glucosyl-3-phosphoglycerate synthase [Haloferula sp. A504]|uniref:glucosyl-3-phosphoglycerate synthase n=1 Tax=Haloferula sp. A504 TaxID=3373601 RepID=UPI0031BFA30E|nr:glucosyl-3-phosphoglycerate synthase [Verrucomicrobiaceae bacterium E54]
MKTFHHTEFADPATLLAEKQRQGIALSVCIPTLNEEGTIARIVSCLRETLITRFPVLDELVVIDSGSTDRTRELAAESGATVQLASDILPNHGERCGKGENLWKAVYECRGDILCFLDGDIGNIDPRFVLGTIGPLLIDPALDYVKGFYERPLLASEGVDPRGGGRVTEILVRPLLKRFFPELARLHQPLSGEYAARRRVLERIPFPTDYGVETSHLIDVARLVGAQAIGQTDLDERIHRNRSLADLGRMSGQILDAFFARLPGGPDSERERPPMMSLDDYLDRFHANPEASRV